MKKKRGISPLIATVLLVGFAITMASIVITFVISETKNIGERIEGMSTDSRYCDSVKFGVEVYKGNGNGLVLGNVDNANVLQNLLIRNKGAFRIFGFRIVTESTSVIYALGDGNGYYIDGDNLDADFRDHTITEKEQVKSSGAPVLIAYFKNNERVLLPIPALNPKNLEDTTFKLAPIIQDPESKEAVVCVDEELSINWRDLCEKHHCEDCRPEDCTLTL